MNIIVKIIWIFIVITTILFWGKLIIAALRSYHNGWKETDTRTAYKKDVEEDNEEDYL